MAKGIEMDKIFYTEAQHNKACYLHKFKKHGKDIVFYNMLAEQYEVTYTDNVFFFFNPFSVDIFRKVIRHILQSIEENPRLVDVILYYPSQDYLQYLLYEVNAQFITEVQLQDQNNINERICVFRLSE